jgi:hypothetical protein
MEKNCYQEIIDEVSKKLAQKIISDEKNLARRATLIDKDIAGIVQEIGLQTTKKVMEDTRDKIVEKKNSEGLTIHKNPTIEFKIIFGKIQLRSPYLWLQGSSSKPLIDDMNITHQGRSEAVNRALSDFGIEDSFAMAAVRFKEHYHYDIGSSSAARSTKEAAQQAMKYVENKLSNVNLESKEANESIDKMLAELDGCEIRTARFVPVEDSTETTPVYNNPKKEKIINWRDVRLGFVRPLDSKSKTFVGKMDTYQEVVSQMHSAAVLTGMTAETKIIGVADGGIGLSEELKRQFPSMQFILDKSHLKDHLYETAEALGINQKDRPGWVKPRVRAISDGNVEAVLKELEEENDKNPNKRLKRLIGYIKRFYDALDYDNFKSLGYPIGSGEIESAHKSIPQKRLKIPGASWNADSIDPMLALRILRADDWWEDFWNQRTESLLAA